VEHLNDRHSPALALRALHHLELRLRGVPSLRDRAPEVNAVRLALRARVEAWTDAQDARLVATAAVRYADEEQDRAVVRLSQGLLLVLDGDRGSARYRRVFPTSPTEVNAGVGTAAQQEAVAQILEASAAEPGVAPLRDAVAAAYAALTAALAERAAAARAEAAARMELVLLMEDVALQYRRFAARLSADGVDPRLVESLFMSLRREPGRAAVDEEEADGVDAG
jgi:hypothetical protein